MPKLPRNKNYSALRERLKREDAAEFARSSPEPDPSELMTDVYVEAAAQ